MNAGIYLKEEVGEIKAVMPVPFSAIDKGRRF